MSTPTTPDPSTRLSFWHLLGLHSFAVVQPILEQLAKNLRYLQQQNFSAVSILLCLALHLTVVPATCWMLITVLRRVRCQKASEALFDFAIFSYCLLMGLIAARWISAAGDLLTSGVPDFLIALAIVPIAVAAVWLHHRSQLFRQLIAMTLVGVLVFPVSFFLSPAVREVVFDWHPSASNAASSNIAKTPVVMIIFDGLTAGSLLDEADQVDAVRFPAFGRLASMSTFYRNTTTVHPRTDHAVPAMLASVYPEGDLAPVEANYPNNLLRLIYETHQFDMTVFEPVTELAPIALQQFKSHRSVLAETWDLFDTTSCVFLQISLPREVSTHMTRLPRAWFGLLPNSPTVNRLLKGKISYPWDNLRTEQVRHFLSTIQSGEKPTFHFLHIALPHYPWSLLPDGRTYAPNASIATLVPGLQHETISSDPWFAAQLWQRNLLQIQMADQSLGQILDRLEEEGLLDDALMVVTADHGMSFLPGEGLREVSGNTLADIVSVPLFIKTPGQKQAEVNDRNVETIDIAPSIAEALRLPVPSEWEGHPVTSPDRKPRKRIVGLTNTIIEPDFPQRRQHTRRLIETFGTGSKDDRLGRLNIVPELVGRVVDTATLPDSEYSAALLLPEPGAQANRPVTDATTNDTAYVPCEIEGFLLANSNELPLKEPVIVAVCVDGTIQATTRTSKDPNDKNAFSALIPWEELTATTSVILIEARREGEQWEFRRIPATPASETPEN
ncbi:MAG: sulfatase-like hydrolase/transferase [Planctomycetaceae bacterium]|nr:sulfatase-like hydrolase/transferase [Planctomycetaceae bacterium]